MTPTPPARELSDLAAVSAALTRGRAVVLPNPAPLTCVVAATRPEAVNTAKQRPAEQAVALWAHHPRTLDALTERLDLGPDALRLARRLLAEEHLTVLAPVRRPEQAPPWLAPATKDGWTLLFGARWQPLTGLLDAFPVLYVSSANRTGHDPAPGPDEALAMFPPEVPVLRSPVADGDHDGPGSVRRAATTTVRLYPDGRLALHRHGAQDRAFADPEQYLARFGNGRGR
ncbi:Sua5/YciO/YrdC/YwlC family protein [Kitasatospora purpeofusca]|uniref:Sua5/YciO/YrdC/YwlC family protein n=1 Tax=Kitasatospora purpeofusca TaxID=67352 RepID=UPI0004C0C724|nr:Sua5/YciO/YrdC/YwlC family protein [Kitasatospora purpeofusca]